MARERLVCCEVEACVSQFSSRGTFYRDKACVKFVEQNNPLHLET